MSKLTDICFPLATNLKSLQKWGLNDIDKRLRQSTILYDNVIVEAGTYDFQGSDRFVLGGYTGWEDNNKETIVRKISDADNSTTDKYITVIDGKTKEEKYRYKVDKKDLYIADFRVVDFISEIESGSYGKECKFLNYLFVQRNDRHRERIRENSVRDLSDREFAEDTEKVHGKMPTVAFLNNLNDTLAISHCLNMPVSVDTIYLPMLQRRTKAQMGMQFQTLERLSKVGIPDFGDLTLEELLVLRKDRGIKSFRGLVAKLSAELQSGNPIEEFVVDELLALNRELAPNKRRLALDISLGVLSFIPNIVAGIGTTLIDTGKELKDYNNYSKTWVSFIHNARALAK